MAYKGGMRQDKSMPGSGLAAVHDQQTAFKQHALLWQQALQQADVLMGQLCKSRVWQARL